MSRLTEKGTVQKYVRKNPVTVYDVEQKLGAYEDAEEQGLLLSLPCKVGDTVWEVRNGKIREYVVRSFNIGNSYIFVSLEYFLARASQSIDCFGKTVFLTKEEAEQKLAEMKG